MNKRERDIDLGNIGDIDNENIYEAPKASFIDKKSITIVSTSKKLMEYAFLLLIALTISAALVQNQLDQKVMGFVYFGLTIVTPILWLCVLIGIFRINRKVNSLGDAIFRLIISLIPIVALYVVYRSSYDAREYLKKHTSKT